MIFSQKGFTLIELLVTISIIAVLTGILTANFIAAGERGSDGQRKSSLLQLQSALEIYRNDQGYYPAALGACGTSIVEGGATYMTKIPCDPDDEAPYQYIATNQEVACDNQDTFCTHYTLYACLENENDKQAEDVEDLSEAELEICPGALFKLVNP